MKKGFVIRTVQDSVALPCERIDLTMSRNTVEAPTAIQFLHNELAKWTLELVSSGRIRYENPKEVWITEFMDRLNRMLPNVEGK